MNLAQLHSSTTVAWSPQLPADSLLINGDLAPAPALQRVQRHLSQLRQRLGIAGHAQVESRNNFPMGTGIASSAAAFAALTVAAVRAANLDLPERELSTLARLGSGSAARSIPAGFVQWHAGDSHASSYAERILPAEHWDLVDVVALLSRQHKRVGSSHGHDSADSSVLQAARVSSAALRLQAAIEALQARDFPRFATVVEEDSLLMHAVMLTSKPPLHYMLPSSLAILQAVRRWRERDGLPVCATMDAGPNVHCICTTAQAAEVQRRLRALIPGLELLVSGVGAGALVLPT